jgi:hypothetical protein
MNLAELKEKIRAEKIHPIHVEDSPHEDDSDGLSFCGNLDEYLQAIHALGKTVVFIATQEFNEDSFIHEVKNKSYNDDNEMEVSIEEIDLCLINPSLQRLKKEIGNIGVFKLSSSMSEDSLNFYIIKDWWVEYVEACYDAVQDIKNRKEEALKERKISKKEKENEIIKSLRNLLKDDNFCCIKTQRAMTSYASENIAGLDMLEPQVLRHEIQRLYDKLRG